MYKPCIVDPHSVLPVPAVCCCHHRTVQVPTIDGTSELVVPPLTLSGEVLRMSGKGVQNARSGHRGSQLVTVRWVLAETVHPTRWAIFS